MVMASDQSNTPNHTPSMNVEEENNVDEVLEDEAHEHEQEEEQPPQEWVTFDNEGSEFGDFEYAPLATDANFEELEESEDASQEVPQVEDSTTSGFLMKQFTQEHIDLIKECMKNVKLAYVPEWAKITPEGTKQTTNNK